MVLQDETTKIANFFLPLEKSWPLLPKPKRDILICICFEISEALEWERY